MNFKFAEKMVASGLCFAGALLAAHGEEIVVGEGETYTVIDAHVYRFKHYRFKIDDCMGTRNGTQLSEIRLLNGDVDVTPLRSGISYDTALLEGTSHLPEAIFDGNLTTKMWIPAGKSGADMSKCWLQVDYENPQPVTAYDWATANDRWYSQNSGDRRDPMKFRFLGSDDGENWTELDSQDIGAKDISRYTWTGPYFVLRDIGSVRVEGGVFEAQTDFSLSGVALISGTMRVPAGRTVRVASNAAVEDAAGSLVVDGTLEVRGGVFAGALSGGGTVKGISASGDFVAICVEENKSFTYNGGILWKDGACLVKAFDGEMTFGGNVMHDVPLMVQGGTLKLAGQTPSFSFRHWRFKIDDCMGGARVGTQISEFRLLNGGTDVTRLRSGFSFGEGMDSSSTQPPAYTIDENLTSKWFTSNGSTSSDMSKCWIQLDFENPQPATAYDWATANDRWYIQSSDDTRDPAKFRLLGSDDGVNWVEADSRDIGSVNISRNSWTGPYYFGDRYGNASLVEGVLEVNESSEFTGVAQSGGAMLIPEGRTVRISAGGTWINPQFAAETKGTIAFSGGASSVMGADVTFPCDVAVEGGTLSFRNGRTTDRFFRLTLKKVHDGGTCAQLSRVMVFDGAGNNIALGLTKVAAGTAPAALQPGECAYDAAYSEGGSSSVEHLFDGKTNSKMCLTGVPQGAEFTRIIYFRLASDEAACSYLFTTANDNTPGRNPVKWTLESSADGVVWKVVDEQTNFVGPTSTYTDFNGGVPMAFSLLMADSVSFAPGACLSVASGATFDVNNVQCEISGLRFDCSKVFGTITRFSPATSGVLRLDNVPADAVLAGYSVPFAPDEIVNAENLQKWKVYVNGKRRMFTAKAEGGEIRLIPSGFTVIIR